MSNAMSLAEKNALSVSYEVLGTRVEMDLDFVKKYLVRGNADKITNQEIVFFMNTCKMQKLNPLVAGEVYCIKFGNDPAQMVVGKGAYLRRAFEHPDYICKEDGIVVERNGQYTHKEGCCLYPGEKLIGGWCRVHYLRHGVERTAYKEVAFSEYDKSQANWKTKPATMICKVATSQCVREAFPKDYEGLYSEEEMVASGAIPTNAEDIPTGGSGNIIDAEQTDENTPITQEQRQVLFMLLKKYYPKEERNEALQELLVSAGCESTNNLMLSTYKELLKGLAEMLVPKMVAEGKAEEIPGMVASMQAQFLAVNITGVFDPEFLDGLNDFDSTGDGGSSHEA